MTIQVNVPWGFRWTFRHEWPGKIMVAKQHIENRIQLKSNYQGAVGTLPQKIHRSDQAATFGGSSW